MKRSDFLSLNTRKSAPQHVENVAATTAVTTTLTPYAGAWGRSEALHLLRRVHFGAPTATLAYLQGLTLQQALDAVLQPQAIPTDLPVNGYNDYLDAGTPPDPFVPLGQPWLTAPYHVDYEWARNMSHLAWWIRQIVEDTGVSVHHKMILFWFNHIPVQAGQVFLAKAYHQYMMTLRTHAFGDFKSLLKAITLEPAMLNFLNGQYNSAYAPDENFARELMELFAIGKGANGAGAGYLESDVLAAAQVLTGWRYTGQNNMTIHFDLSEHKIGNKQFSAFFNNTIITGGTTAATGDSELNQLLDMLLAHPECAKFICRKLYRFFVYDNIPAQTETDIIIPLANICRNSGYDIALTLRTLLSSEHFFDTAFRAAMIKSPADYTLGNVRELHCALPLVTDYGYSYRVGLHLWWYMNIAQMGLTDPPNVAGWPAWYQLNVFDRAWITTDSMPNRAILMDSNIFQWLNINNNGFIFGCDVIAFTQSLNAPEDAVTLVNDLVALAYSIDVPQTTKNKAIAQLITPQTDTIYWEQAWNWYLANPTDPNAIGNIKWRLGKCYQAIFQEPEYHLM